MVCLSDASRTGILFKVNEDAMKSHIILATDCNIELSHSYRVHQYEISMHQFKKIPFRETSDRQARFDFGIPRQF